MRPRRISALLTGIGLVLCLPRAAEAGDPIAIVVAETFPATELSMAELRGIFLGKRRQTDDGTRLVPLNMKEGDPTRTAFDRVVLDMSSDDVARYWVDQRIRGAGVGPKTLSSPKLVIAIVKKLPGAIGYLPATAVVPGIKVLTIEGWRPRDEEYPLRAPDEEAQTKAPKKARKKKPKEAPEGAPKEAAPKKPVEQSTEAPGGTAEPQNR